MRRVAAVILMLVAGFASTGSRQFVEGSSQYLDRTSSPIGTYPCTISVWFKVGSLANNHSLVYLGSTADARRMLLYVEGSAAGNHIRLSTVPNGGGSGTDIISTATVSAGTWINVVGVWTSATSRALYVNGVADGTSAVSVTVSSLGRYAIGARGSPAPTYGVYHDGYIGEVGIWNTALSAADAAELAVGENPRKVRPSTELVSYVPLWDPLSPVVDLVGGTFTVNGATFSNDHPPVFQ